MFLQFFCIVCKFLTDQFESSYKYRIKSVGCCLWLEIFITGMIFQQSLERFVISINAFQKRNTTKASMIGVYLMKNDTWFYVKLLVQHELLQLNIYDLDRENHPVSLLFCSMHRHVYSQKHKTPLHTYTLTVNIRTTVKAILSQTKEESWIALIPP